MKSTRLLSRFAVIGGLMLLLLVPLSMISGLIHEREAYRAEAVQRVTQNVAGAQRFVGPLRVVPWVDTQTVSYTDNDGVPRSRVERRNGYTLQTPATLDVVGALEPRKLRSGLFEVAVYEWRATLQASFVDRLPAAAEGVQRAYGKAYLAFGISDVRGLVGTPTLALDGHALPLQAGTGEVKNLDGLSAALPESKGDGTVHALRMQFVLKGTQALAIAPVADANHIALDSPWPSPQFDGGPRSEVGADGFRATWDVPALSSNLQARLQQGDFDTGDVGVKLIERIDVYTLADRASKYGILFVALTFVGFVLFELLKRLPIHPLQYLLVGFALAIFFLLLLSLSERIAFWQAYLVSAAACIGLQFAYLSGVLKSRARATGFAAMLAALYGVLYGLLVSEDNALLMGSLLLFGILAAIMLATRKLDWYELGIASRGDGHVES